MSEIHSTAIIHPSATVGDHVTIGPYTEICENVTIGNGVHIFGWTIIGARGDIYQMRGEECLGRLIIGNRVIIREHATIHRGYEAGSITSIGDDSYVMAHAYVGHDAKIGKCAVLSAGCIIGGFTVVGDFCWIGLNATLHQRLKIGESTIIGMGAVVTKDVPEFCKAFGSPAKIKGANEVGIRRRFQGNFYDEI